MSLSFKPENIMKSFLLIFAGLLLSSTSHARIVHYSCASYADKEPATLNLETQTLDMNAIFRGQNIEGRSTAKVTPNVHLPFINAAGEELEIYLDVKAKVLSIRNNTGVIYQAYCL
jgi:hypothetical protein